MHRKKSANWIIFSLASIFICCWHEKLFFSLHHHSVLLFRLPCANINSTQTIFVSLKCKFKMQTLKLQNVLLQNRSQKQLKIYRVPFLVKGGRALRFERHVAIICITFTSFVNSISLSIAVVSVGFFYAIPSSSLRRRRKTEAQHHRTYNEFSIHWIFPNPDVLCWIFICYSPPSHVAPFSLLWKSHEKF